MEKHRRFSAGFRGEHRVISTLRLLDVARPGPSSSPTDENSASRHRGLRPHAVQCGGPVDIDFSRRPRMHKHCGAGIPQWDFMELWPRPRTKPRPASDGCEHEGGFGFLGTRIGCRGDVLSRPGTGRPGRLRAACQSPGDGARRPLRAATVWCRAAFGHRWT